MGVKRGYREMQANIVESRQASAWTPFQPITFTLPWPPSANHHWRHIGPRVIISRKGRLYREEVAIRCHGIGPLQGRLSVFITAFPPDRRRRDLDNLMKPLLDAIQHAGVFPDDGAIDDLRILRGSVRHGGMLTITISEAAK